MYEVNPWLRQFGRGKPRLGGLTVEQTMARKNAVVDARHKRQWRRNGVARRLQPDFNENVGFGGIY